ncbi:MAG: hypothetical protein ACI9FU_000952 [Granulosicoccus sp.]|jgi:hypothetical protein
MDWKAIITGTWDTEMSQQLVDEMLRDESLFHEVFEAFYNGDSQQIAHRSGHLLGRVFKKSPEWLYPRIEILFEKMNTPPCPTFRWYVLYYMSHTAYDQKHDGPTANYAFQELDNRGNKPGVKNTCMRLLEKICRRTPEFNTEFKLYLEELIVYERRSLVCKAKSQIKLLQKWERIQE